MLDLSYLNITLYQMLDFYIMILLVSSSF